MHTHPSLGFKHTTTTTSLFAGLLGRVAVPPHSNTNPNPGSRRALNAGGIAATAEGAAVAGRAVGSSRQPIRPATRGRCIIASTILGGHRPGIRPAACRPGASCKPPASTVARNTTAVRICPAIVDARPRHPPYHRHQPRTCTCTRAAEPRARCNCLVAQHGPCKLLTACPHSQCCILSCIPSLDGCLPCSMPSPPHPPQKLPLI